MCFFDKQDLQEMVNDQNIFSSFTLMERERHIIYARVVKKMKYKHLAPVYDISIARTQQLYQQGIDKMKAQMIEGIQKK